MSKLAIFLCAVLFASAANAFFIRRPLEIAQENLSNLLERTESNVRLSIAEVTRKADEVRAKIEEEILKQDIKASTDVTSKVDKAVTDVNELINDVRNIDVTECQRFRSHLQSTADSAIREMKNCLNKTRTTATNKIQNALDISNGVLNNLNQLKQEGLQCIENIDGPVARWRAFTCTISVKFKAGLAALGAVPSITIQATKLGSLVVTFPLTLTYCTASTAFSVFNSESSSIVRETNQCIQQKINEFRNLNNPNIPEITPQSGNTTQGPTLSASRIDSIVDELLP